MSDPHPQQDPIDTDSDDQLAVSSTYKVRGEDALSSGAGVLGTNTAGSGTPIGVEGAVPNNTADGYGLSTPHDANVGGTAELAAIGGGVTGNSRLTSLTGDGLTLASEALALGPTSVTTDTASTFAESGVSINHSKTTVTDGAIKLSPYVSRPDDNNSYQYYSVKYGLEFEPQADLSEITATISSNTSGESTVYIYDGDANQLTSEPSPGAGNSVTLTASLSASTKYYIVVDDGGNSYTSGYYDNASFPYTSSAVDITSGAYEDSGLIGSASYAHAIKSLGESASSGTATVEFSQPASVRRWESASFQADHDRETVAVFVETSSDGGSTWTDWQSKPIGPGTDLTAIRAGDRVRFRVELSRGDIANDPRVTLLSRQYSP